MSENEEFLNTASILNRLKRSTYENYGSGVEDKGQRKVGGMDKINRTRRGIPDDERFRRREVWKKQEEGIELPEGRWKSGFFIDSRPENMNPSSVNKYYSLIPRNPRPDQDIYAYAHITWNSRESSLIYKVVEPVLSDEDEELVSDIREELEEKLDVDFEKIGKVKAKKYLSEKIDEALSMMGKRAKGERKKAIKYYLNRNLIGLGKIEPIMRDPGIEDISCDGVSVPVKIRHRNPVYGSMDTNIAFENPESARSFVKKLAQKARKSLSVANPIINGILPDGSGVQATLGGDVARRGPNFTIEKFRKKPYTPTELIEFGTVDPRTLAYLWMAIENQKSILIYGGSLTGKTALLNAIALMINPDKRIVSIERSPEIRLPQGHWIPEVAASADEKEEGVDVKKLLKESLRQNPDYLIVGEIIGEEVSTLFREMSAGCPSLSTINSESIEGLSERLTTEPIGIHPSLLENLDVMISMSKKRLDKGYKRKIDKVLERKEYSTSKGKLETNKLLERKWNGELESKNNSVLLERIADERGIDEEEVKNDLKDRMKILEWMAENGIRGLDDINETVEMYEEDGEELMARVESSW